ncbi:MAG: hypothetical protein ACOYMR_17880 [Ilumatobacteraceae bacterium]
MRRWMAAMLAVGLTAGVGVMPSAAHAVAVTVEGGCLGAPGPYFCDEWTTTSRPRGSIALIGDSVLLGSADGASSPSLVQDLDARGWGPIRLTTAVGLRTALNGPGTPPSDLIAKWATDGVRPRVVAVNLGAGYLVPCGTDPQVCAGAIAAVSDAVWSRWPAAVIWWAKINHTTWPTLEPSPGMVHWNAALDAAAQQHPGRMVLWDWPAALQQSDIGTDFGNVHPASPSDYAKRSVLLANHLTAFTPATFTGPRVAVPGARAGASEFVPQADAGAGVVGSFALTAGVTRTIDVGAALPAAIGRTGVVLGAAAASATASGTVRIHECGRASTPDATLFVTAGATPTAQALVPLTVGNRVCATATTAVTLRLSVQGALAADGGTRYVRLAPATPTITPANTPAGTPGVSSITLPALAVGGVTAAAVTVTVDGASGGGRMTLHRCGATPSTVPTLAFAAGAARSASAYVPVAGGAVCMTTSFPGAAPRLRVAVTGVFTATGSGARFRFAGTPTRMLDLRPASRRGGWFGRQVATQRIAVPVAPAGAAAVVGTVTISSTLVAGELATGPHDDATAALPALAFGRGGITTTATMTTSTGTSGVIDLRMRRGNAATTLDVVGWWIP